MGGRRTAEHTDPQVEGLAVRPDHRMVAHTGFLTSARLIEPAAAAAVKRRSARRMGGVGLLAILVVVLTAAWQP